MHLDTQADPASPSAVMTLLADPVAAAKAAGLHYLSDTGPCIRRIRCGAKKFRYVGPDNKPIRDPDELRRVRSLGIPPAWTDVWICPDADGHIQATGRDVKGRKQYRYHARWRELRDETKYNKMLEFGAALPLIRERTDKDLALPGLPREKVLAAVVRLLEGTLIRVGNEEYARTNGSFGLTTMRDWHVDIEGSRLRFHFRGKSGKDHNVDLRDRRLAKIVKKCQDIPGHELFQFIGDDGHRHTIGSADVNDYLRSITGKDFTAKDFRTWAGTVLASLALQAFEGFDSQTQAKKNVVQAIKSVSERLGNTPAICRKCYIHPAVLDSYMDGSMLQTLKKHTEAVMAEELQNLRPEEAAVMAFLQERLKQEVNRRDTLADDLAASLKQPSKRRPASVRTADRARSKSSRAGGRSGSAARPNRKRAAPVAHKKPGGRGRRS
jgi:DNA topoisomerase-1